ncbi:S-methyl-5'-thioadenosine phosphorylase [Rhodobacteraceae bacterium 2CG4]|uniref:Purine nucleoside phosphorylase n=1 Tax=Halovulum marinum TaxID=2662447 RepID=A0A6L5Z6J1_9RHOB|nr:MTAP family purine nucleoside phosphorylase [Halovulum marinum]MSU92077.1 S-methyl-5'-thioadenosine phosphorylase [Halovulum marinum]
MSDAPIGLISSAASEELLKNRKAERVSTPWGEAEILLGEIAGRQAAVLLRYGTNLTTPSHKINYRANIWAMRELGVDAIISQNAIGSVNTAIRPGDIVVPDDFLDKTKSRPQSLFDDSECWVRVDFTDPFCPALRAELIDAATAVSDRVIERGVFVCTEGPRFETPAEIRAYQMEGGDIVGTPLVPEVIFAREAEICFASIAPVINFGAGMAPAVVHFGPGSMNESYYSDGLHDLIEKVIISAFKGHSPERVCTCRTALDGGFHGSPPEWFRSREKVKAEAL